VNTLFLGNVSLKYPVWGRASILRFLILKKLSAQDIRAELEGVYGHEGLSLSAAKKWYKRSANGRISPQNDLCESMLALIGKSHFIPCKDMCQKFPIAKTACLRVL
jgi:hypothetical protein